MRVIVIGAGIGGLALACGLRKHGVDVEVFERDSVLADTGGYHLHLHGRALAALRRLLPPNAVETLYASSATGRADQQVAMRDHRGRLLAVQRRDDDDSLNVDRVTLRCLLGDTAGAGLRLGRRCVDHESTDSGVEARFADGTTATGDVLVGADGVGSAVAHRLAGRPTTAPVGVLGIGGFTPVDELSRCTAALYGRNSAFSVGPRGTGLYVGYHDPVGAAAVRSPMARPMTPVPTYIWGAMITGCGGHLLGATGGELRDATAAAFRRAGWSDRAIEVIARAKTVGVAAFPLNAATDPDGLAPWPAGRVTALGDAVHAVPPTGGQGAATAILDAEALCDELVAAGRGDKTAVLAVHDFERRMRHHARPAVVDSLRPIGWITATESAPASALLRATVPVLAAGQALVRGAVGRLLR